MTKHPKIKIVVDTREQDPLDFSGLNCTVQVGTVHVFDYCLEGDNGFAIERKSLPDFVGSITGRKAIQERELEKVHRARKCFDVGMPMIYVVESTFSGILPERSCSCVHLRASKTCPLCKGKAVSYCTCIKERPDLDCEFCRGTGILGYDYGRRKIGSPFAYHQLSQWIYTHKVSVLFADTRVASACMIEAILRRRFEMLLLAKQDKQEKET